MKSRFNSFDVACVVTELQELIGLRVNQIYDVDSKTYLIKLQGKQGKSLQNEAFHLLIESGTRFHTTQFQWPKNNSPSGFAMKMRKHLKNKRLEKVRQLEGDRIVYFAFGSKEAAYYVFLELYDRGNIVLTDHEYTILYLLRSHSEEDKVRFAVREKYPLNRTPKYVQPTEESLREFLRSSKAGVYLRRALIPVLEVGPSVIEHVLIKYGLNNCVISNEEVIEANQWQQQRKSKELLDSTSDSSFEVGRNLPQLILAVQECYDMLHKARNEVSEGYIIQRKVEVPSTDGEEQKFNFHNIEFHPYYFSQFKDQPFSKFKSFCLAVDDFYSHLAEQKIDQKTHQQEQEAIKKLSNVKRDHMLRLEELCKSQEVDKIKAEIIVSNQQLVDNAILAVRSALANQMSWHDVNELITAAQAGEDDVANAISQLKLDVDQMSLKLPTLEFLKNTDPGNNTKSEDYAIIDVDLNMTALANARKYYHKKRMAADKQQKTIDASEKALKNAERKTHKILKDVRTISNICKVRKVFWFEKFHWFVSSENFLVIGGRDAQQNELIVKRYMRPNDVYVHAEIQGASSVVIRNSTENEVPPKTLLEAGTMALSQSVAWDAKVITNVYWVKSEQVSKKAPTGEYLGTGSFMIRGKKNFLPSCNLVMGIGLLFRLEDSFVDAHTGERKIRTVEEEREDEKSQLIGGELRDNLNPQDAESGCMIKMKGSKIFPKDKTTLENINDKESIEFPDNCVKIEHDLLCRKIEKGTQNDYSLKKDDSLICAENNIAEIESTTVILAKPSRMKQQQKDKRGKEEKQPKKAEKIRCSEVSLRNAKRGQRQKIKKVKSKYKDQDEEERLHRMDILQPYGKVELSVTPNIDQSNEPVCNEPVCNEPVCNEPVCNEPPQHNEEKHRGSQEDKDEEVDIAPSDAVVDMLDTLTGKPYNDDELLFALPVVAPYQAIQSYKYKLKIIPGTTKRGKAVKTALEIFFNDKQCNSRQRDLLKSIKEDMLARNVPGRVKIANSTLKSKGNTARNRI